MKRVLVTGGAGFIGSNLAFELERSGVSVVVLDDFSSGSFENLVGFRGDVVTADISAGPGWFDRVGAVDAVFHQAAVTDTTVTDQRRMMAVNVEGFRSVLDFAVKTGARRVVYASSAGVYGDGACPMSEAQEAKPLNVYAFSKRVMERVAADFCRRVPGTTLVGLRYFNVYGPRESFKGKAASMIWQLSRQMAAGRRPRIFKHGEQYRDFIYVKDVVDANLKAAAAAKGGIYNVCTGQKTDFNRVVEVLNEVLGTRLAPEYFDNPYGFYQNQTLGDARGAALELNFKARYAVPEGVADYLGGGRVPVGAA